MISLLAVPAAVVIYMAAYTATLGDSSEMGADLHRIFGLAAAVILGAGVAAGLVALLGLQSHGRNGILMPAVLGLTLPIVLVALAIFVLPWGTKAMTSLKQGEQNFVVDAQLAAIAAQENEKGPRMVDEITRLDSVESLGGRKFLYQYTVTNVERNTLDLALFDREMRKNLLEPYRTNPKMEYFRKNGVTLIYRYKDKSGEAIDEVELTPKDLRK